MAFHILEKFPEKSQAIACLLEEDSEFLAVCEDYDVCVNALRYWAKSEAPEAETRVNEYRTLIVELEEEVTLALAALKPRQMD